MNDQLELAEDCLKKILRQAESLSGHCVHFDKLAADHRLIGTTEVAWKKKRDYHVVRINESLDRSLHIHACVHELYHIILEAKARAAGAYREITFTRENHLRAVESIATELGALGEVIPSAAQLGPVVQRLVEGLVSLLYNAPLDMMIEDMIKEQNPELALVQKKAESLILQRSYLSISDSDNTRLMPNRILKSSRLLNAAYALSADSRWAGELQAARPYMMFNDMERAHVLFELWRSKAVPLTPGDEYGLIDKYAGFLGIRDWFTWQNNPAQ